MLRSATRDQPIRRPRNTTLWIAGPVLGLAIGLASGMLGIGGGILLGPIILLARWATPRETAAISSMTVLTLSIAGLAAHGLRGSVDVRFVAPLAVAVLVGGLIGAHLSVTRLSPAMLKRIFAAIILVAAVKAAVTATTPESHPPSGPLRPETTSSTGLREPRTVTESPRHVVVVSIDTLRHDHLGCYGYTPPVSPAIDAFAARSIVFDQAIAHAPSTLPSHASIFTSVIPEHHGAFVFRETGIATGTPTLARVLSSAGFTTAAFTGGGQMAPEYGLDDGFALYAVRPAEERFAETVEAALEWWDGATPDRVFLFLHSYEVHHPYTPDPRWLGELSAEYDGPLPDAISVQLLEDINAGRVQINRADLDHIVAAYDAEIRSMDTGWALLIDQLQRRGWLDESLIVFTSDHGEEFGEHGLVGWHSHTLYDELLRVPLIVRFPHGWSGGTRIPQQVRSIDIGPTVLAAIGAPTPQSFQGTNLLSFLGSVTPIPKLPAVSQQDTPRRLQLFSVRTETRKLVPRRLHDDSPFEHPGLAWKIIRRAYELFRPFVLFNLEEDPGETVDLSARHAGEIERLTKVLDAAVSTAPTGVGRPVDIDDETTRRLRALGYVTSDER
jgi:hypothetical protein